MNCRKVVFAQLHWPLAALHGGDDRHGHCRQAPAGQGLNR